MEPEPTIPLHGLLLNAEYEHARVISLARRAEALGFGDFWYADERFYREPYVGLAAAAVATERIRLGPGVTDPYTRHAALTATAMASLDELSAGRAMLGIGAGLSGFRNLGLRPERSTQRLRESLAIMRQLWAGQEVTYEGQEVSIWNASLKFAARPEIPVYLAANGPQNMRLAGEMADGAMIPHCAAPELLQPQLQLVHEGAARAQRAAPPPIIARLDVSVSHDREAAYFQAKVRLARLLWAQYPSIGYLARLGLRLPSELEGRLREAGPFPGGHNLALFRPFAEAIPDELLAPIALAGTPEEVAQQAQRTIDAGADQIMAYLLVPAGESIESVVELYGREVIPHLRPAGRP